MHVTENLSPLSRFGRPSKIVFLDSDGTTAFEFKVPKGQSDMVRHYFHRDRKQSPLASICIVQSVSPLCVGVFPEGGVKVGDDVMNGLTIEQYSQGLTCFLISHHEIINNEPPTCSYTYTVTPPFCFNAFI